MIGDSANSSSHSYSHDVDARIVQSSSSATSSSYSTYNPTANSTKKSTSTGPRNTTTANTAAAVAADTSTPISTSTSPSRRTHLHHNHNQHQHQYNTLHNADASPDGSSTLALDDDVARLTNLDLSKEESASRSDLLRHSVFPDWKDDAAHAGLESPDEMQKKDPLATQIWKLYSKTKSQLPNQERMENLTWRMMAMSMKRKEREAAL